MDSLIAAGLMTLAGIATIDAAKRDGSWSTFDDAESLRMPEDLVAAFGRKDTASRHFDAFAPSARKVILTWILSAKRPETRAKRIAETAWLAAENIRANQSGKRVSPTADTPDRGIGRCTSR